MDEFWVKQLEKHSMENSLLSDRAFHSTKFVIFKTWRTRTVSNKLKNTQHLAYAKPLMSGSEWLWSPIFQTNQVFISSLSVGV